MEVGKMPRRMIDRLSKDQLDAILNALPIELIFVDENDRLQYCNKAERQAQMSQRDILGRDVRDCHKPESLPRTDQMLDDLRSGRKDEDEFWVDGLGVKLLNRFLAVRDESGGYLGCIEYLLNFTALEELAEAKKGSHRFVSNQRDTSESQEAR
jgi:PAS domain S-box-containing protein